MPDHQHAPSPNPEDKLPNQRFFAWLKSRTALFFSQLLAVLGFIYVPTSTIYYTAHLAGSEALRNFNPYLLVIVDVAHIAVLMLFVAVLMKIRHNDKEGSYRTLRAYESLFKENLEDNKAKLKVKQSRLQLRRFERYFLWFWMAMLALYISFFFKHLSELDYVSPSLILGARGALRFLLLPFLTFALNNLSMMFIFWCFLIMYRPSYDRRSNAKHRLYIESYSFGFVILTLLYPLLFLFVHRIYQGNFASQTLTNYATVFDGVSGVLNAVVLALLIARLDSKLIGLPSGLIGLLYFYSAVQPLFAVFESVGVFKFIQTSVLIIVFGFKIYFFLIIVYALQTGRMLNYLICFPQLERRVDSIWDNQFEVRASQENDTLFHLAITSKNKKAYTSSDHFKTIEDCDKENAELRKVMKQRSSYRLGNATGTHWVDVFNSHGHKIFYSLALKSEEEANDLINESMNKIPYCKYDRG